MGEFHDEMKRQASLASSAECRLEDQEAMRNSHWRTVYLYAFRKGAEWASRTPPPATAKLIEWLRDPATAPSPQDAIREMGPLLADFLAEWPADPAPGTPPPPATADAGKEVAGG